MEASWWKVAGFLLFLCTVVSAVRMPHRRHFQQKRIQHVIEDRTALSGRTTVIAPPNVPHTEGNPPQPVRQPWYRHIGADNRQSRRRSHLNNRRLRVHKKFDEVAVHNLGSKPETQDVPKRPVKELRQNKLSGKNKLSNTKMAVTENVDDTNIPDIAVMLDRHASRMNKLKRRKGHMGKVSGRRHLHSRRRKLSNFKKGCRMRKACSIRSVHHRPVCGSDGVTYDNKCMLKVAACMKGSRHAITATHPNACQEQRPL